MVNGKQNERPLQDTAIVQAMKKEYPFLKNWRDYNFDDERALYNSKFESICSDWQGTAKYLNKHNCIKLFSIIDTVINRGKVKGDDEIWKSLKEWFEKPNKNTEFTPELIKKYINEIGDELNKVLQNDFRKFKSTHENNIEFGHIAMLFYFIQNVAEIKPLMENPSNSQFPSACAFVNHCLEIYRQIKELKCSGNSSTNYSGSTICVEINSFLEKYKTFLYPNLKKWEIVDIPKGADGPIDAPLKCPYETSKRSFLSNYPGYDTDLSFGGKVGVISASALLVSVSLFMLYKFTPLGYMFGRERRGRRTWIGMGHPYRQGMHDGMSSMGPSSEGTDYMPYYSSQGMGGNGNYGVQGFGSDPSMGSGQTLGGSSYGSSQMLGGSRGGSSQMFGSSTGGSSQMFGSATGGSSQMFGSSTGGSSQMFGGPRGGSSQMFGSATGGSSQTLGGSSYGPSQSFGGSTYGTSQTLGGSTRGESRTSRRPKRGATETSASSTLGESVTSRGSTRAESVTSRGSSDTESVASSATSASSQMSRGS
ncbi:KIR-like protein [Plasmodium coatneyi]|uniref:KIR-like protein n=1 Tax=Plasmodium coatneyi TaxID=208452 RepID=A0A1B1DTC5_9APIC|nr:KIR-like protein [Plasmodium coatneyi]ANQ06038.1 KIR-like protein [Plasmodium coatneyi]